MTNPIISLSEIFYNKVQANSVVQSTGVIIPNGEKHAIFRFRANGSDPLSYVRLVWDHNGDQEKIFSSTKGDIDLIFDPSDESNIIDGNGVKKLSIVLENNTDSESPYIGGEFELIKVG